MIELIFMMFFLQKNIIGLQNADESMADKRFCAQIQLAASFVRTEEIYPIAEKRFEDDESNLESFYAFWENIDTCIPY